MAPIKTDSDRDDRLYAIRGGEEGTARLRLMSRVLAPSTNSFLDRAGLRPGMSCLDAGCGGGDVTLEMARVVGQAGRVLGIDMDGVKVELAREETLRASLPQATFQVMDVTRLEAPPFDFIYARFLLSHLQDPAVHLTRFVDLLQPGGILAVEDIDFEGVQAWPPNPALSRYAELYQQLIRRRGADPNIGPKLYNLLMDAGLAKVEVQLVHHVFAKGEGKRIDPITLENIAAALVQEGLASREEIDGLMRELDQMVRDERILSGMPRIFQVYGRKAVTSEPFPSPVSEPRAGGRT